MAIAFDAATNGGNTTGTSLTFSHTVTGTNTFLFVGILGRVAATSNITGVTYNGVALSKLDGQEIPSDRFLEAWYLVGPATGANNVVISASSSDFISGNAASYTGVNPSGQPDASHSNFQASGSPNTNTLTTIANNCWHLMAGGNASGTPTAGTGSTIRSTANGNMAMFDGNGAITSAGSDSIGMTGMNSSFGSGTIGLSISPFIPIKGGTLSMMGV